MSPHLDEARAAVLKAREALRNNDRGQARQWAEKAAQLAPQLEDPWLVLAAVASPRASLQYVQRALRINPGSSRARRGMQWALQRLQDPEASSAETQRRQPASVNGSSVALPAVHAPVQRASRRSPLFPVLLLVLGSVVCAAAAWSASQMPVLASMIQSAPVAASTRPPSWAIASIPRPADTAAVPLSLAELQPGTTTPELLPTPGSEALGDEPALSTDLSTDLSAEQPTQVAAELPALTDTESSIPTAEPTWSGSLSMDVLPDTPTAVIPTHVPVATAAPSSPGSVASGGRHWIDVNLTQQTLYAYAGDTVMNSFLVSTGTWMHPTVIGKYHIYVKLRYTDMSGSDYYLPNVPYTMYFYEGYGLHGTYWHHNFGTPMSHGCVNLSIADAEWLYNFASVGTVVNVHY